MTGSTPTWTCARSHLFPGARLTVPEPELRHGAGTLRLSDGVAVDAVLGAREDGGSDLSVPAYRTGRGTEMAAARWLLAEAEPDAAELRVLARLT